MRHLLLRNNAASYYRARYYDSQAGRFISEDPIGTNSNTLYGYTKNDPIGFTDPSGLFTTRDEIVQHRTLSIDQMCDARTGGACTRVRAALVMCACQCDGGTWKARAELRLYGDMYIYSGPFTLLHRQPRDQTVHDADSAVQHEYGVHINPATNAVTPAIRELEAKKFTSEKECYSECDKTSAAVDALFRRTLRATLRSEINGQ